MKKLIKIFVLITMIVGGMYIYTFISLKEPKESASAFMMALKSDDMMTAYSLMSEQMRKNTQNKELENFLKINYGSRIVEWQWQSEKISLGGLATFKGIATNEIGQSSSISLIFKKFDQEWKLYSITK